MSFHVLSTASCMNDEHTGWTVTEVRVMHYRLVLPTFCDAQESREGESLGQELVAALQVQTSEIKKEEKKRRKTREGHRQEVRLFLLSIFFFFFLLSPHKQQGACPGPPCLSCTQGRNGTPGLRRDKADSES